MAAATYFDQVQKLYIAFYQRPADPAGLVYWAQRIDAAGGNASAVVAAFAESAESVALYGNITTANIGSVLDSLYTALFNHLPDAAGKAFYEAGFNAGTFTPGSIALNVLNGALNDDAVSIANKLQVSNTFTALVDGRAMTDPTFGQGTTFAATYAGEPDAIAARLILATVTSNPATVMSSAQVTTEIQNKIADAGDPILAASSGQTFTLTTGVDNITGTAGNDTTNAILGTGATLNPFDSLTGGAGTGDILNIADSSTGAFAMPASTTISGFETVNVSRSGAATTTTITNTTFGTGVTAFSLTDAGTGASSPQSVTLASAASVSLVASGTNPFSTVAVTDTSTTAASTGSTLKTVSINNSTGAGTLTGNGITTLNLTNATGLQTVTAAAGTRALTVNVAGASGGGVTDATATTATINSTVTAAGAVGTFTTAAATTVNYNTTTANGGGAAVITAAAATTLNVGGSAVATLALTGSTALTTVNVSGTAGLTTDLTAAATGVTALNFTNTAGKSTVTVNTGTAVTGGAGVEVITVASTTKAIALGAGNDTANVTVTALGVGGSIAGGDGTDVLKLANADAVTLSTAGAVQTAFKAAVTGFETLDITTQTASTVNVAAVGTFSTVKMVSASAAQVLSGVTSGQTIEMVFGVAGTSVTTNQLTAPSDSLTLKLGGDLSAANQVFGAFNTPGVETVNIVMADTNTTFVTKLATATVNDTNASSVIVTGNNGLALTLNNDAGAALSTTLTNLNASGLTKGALTFTSGVLTTDATVVGSLLGGDTLNFGAATSKITMTATAGTNALTGSATFANTITGGSGADTIVGGSAIDTINGGAGNDIITGGAAADVINVGAGTDNVTVASADTGAGTATAGSLTAAGVIGAATLSFASTAMDVITGMGTAGDNVQLTIGAPNSAVLLTGASTWGAATVGDVALVRGNNAAGVFTASTSGTDSALIWDSNGTTAAGTYQAIILVGYVDTGTADTISTGGLFTIV